MPARLQRNSWRTGCLSHSFPSPVPTVPLPSFSPDSSQPLLRRPLLLPRGRGLSQPLIANIQGLKELGEGEEVDREVSPSILNIEEKEQSDNLQWVNRTRPCPYLLGCFPPLRTPHMRTHTPDSHLPLWPIPPDFWYPEGSLIPYLPIGDYPTVPSPLGKTNRDATTVVS
jgi:hypothetical protein